MILASIPSPAQGVWHLGPVPIRAYALCIIIGIVVACWWGDRRWVARGGKPGQVLDVAVWAVPFGLIGGRLYHVLTDFSTYFGPNGRGLGAVFRIWDGGLGIWGAVALGGVGAAIGCRQLGIKLGPFADAIAPAIIVAQAIGRLGNWFNQELYGGPTTLPWGLEIYERANDVGQRGPDVLDGHSTGVVLAVVQPTFLYELIWNLLVAAFLVIVDRRFRIGHGRLFALYVAGYCLGRFFIELMRDDHATLIFGVRINVFTAALVFAGAIAYFFLAPKRREDSVLLDEPSAAPSESAPEQGGSRPVDEPVALEKAGDGADAEADVRQMDTGGLPGDSTSRNRED
ncbi:prolipoprotein diacylglyceryl transferase [Tsukamurella ocularis]|uniref:prolipoprotein diacylglyceryl transferase n=1 Tax=Tsukamurella ocularis TaxID=1970234 RepID=UPI00216713F4|nr:prolipoprotein diacylglyceryl transferase [Tsukamurella ocularis]MCS3782083.1 prolipoprotein diacylglyceryl transferase [Tsukamurella ocularis]MCS3789757.1 prolipoprotein diacylglyceryl transferase [Tsukamurella ocularis]MCS3852904.1 prolipoprotein diacylglyceryl transferase [Tsukamurella ocularis]